MGLFNTVLRYFYWLGVYTNIGTERSNYLSMPYIPAPGTHTLHSDTDIAGCNYLSALFVPACGTHQTVSLTMLGQDYVIYILSCPLIWWLMTVLFLQDQLSCLHAESLFCPKFWKVRFTNPVCLNLCLIFSQQKWDKSQQKWDKRGLSKVRVGASIIDLWCWFWHWREYHCI